MASPTASSSNARSLESVVYSKNTPMRSLESVVYSKKALSVDWDPDAEDDDEGFDREIDWFSEYANEKDMLAAQAFGEEDEDDEIRSRVSSARDFIGSAVGSQRIPRIIADLPSGSNDREQIIGIDDNPLRFVDEKIAELRKTRVDRPELVNLCLNAARDVRRRQAEKFDGKTLEDKVVQGYDWKTEVGDPLENMYANCGFAEVMSMMTTPSRIHASSDLVDDVVRSLQSTCITQQKLRETMIYFWTNVVVEKPTKSPETYIEKANTYSVGIRLLWAGLLLNETGVSAGYGVRPYVEGENVDVRRVRTNISTGKKYVLEFVNFTSGMISEYRDSTQADFNDVRNFPRPFTRIPIKVGSKYCYFSEHPCPESHLKGFYIVAGNSKDSTTGAVSAQLFVTTAVQIRKQGVFAYFEINGVDSAAFTFRGLRGHGRITLWKNTRQTEDSMKELAMNLTKVLPYEKEGELLVQLFELQKQGTTIGPIPGRFNALVLLGKLYQLANDPSADLTQCIARVYRQILSNFSDEIQVLLGKLDDETEEIDTESDAHMRVTYVRAVELSAESHLGFAYTAYLVKNPKDETAEYAMAKILEHYGASEAKGVENNLYDLIIREMFSIEGYSEPESTVYKTRYDTLLQMIVYYLSISMNVIPQPDEDDWRNKQVTSFEQSGLLADVRIMLLRMQRAMRDGEVAREGNKESKLEKNNAQYKNVVPLGLAIEGAVTRRILQTGAYGEQVGTNVLEASHPITHPTQAEINSILAIIAAKMDARSKDEKKKGHDRSREPHINYGGRKDTPNAVGRRSTSSVVTHISKPRGNFANIIGAEIANYKRIYKRERRGVKFADTMYPVIVNYVTVGEVPDIDGFEMYLREKKRTSELPFDIGIYNQKNELLDDPARRELIITFNIGRLIFPMLIVDRTQDGIVPLCVDYINVLHALYQKHTTVDAMRIFIARCLPEMFAKGMIEYLDITEKEIENYRGYSVASNFTSLASITLPNGSKLVNKQRYCLPGPYCHGHIFGGHNSANQSIARGPYGQERHKQELYGSNPLTETKPVNHRVLTKGHRSLVQASGLIWYGGNDLAACYNTTAVSMDYTSMAEEARTYGRQINFERKYIDNITGNFRKQTQPNGEEIEFYNNPLSVGYTLEQIASLLGDKGELHIRDHVINVNGVNVKVLLPVIGTQVYPGLKLIPRFAKPPTDMKRGWIAASSKISGVVTRCSVVMSLPTSQSMQHSLNVASIEVQVTHILKGTTGLKGSNEGGQKGIAGISPSMQDIPHYMGSPIGELVSSQVLVKRDTPTWLRQLALNALAVNCWTRPKFFHGMRFKNPAQEEVKQFYRIVGYKPRVPFTNASGESIGLGTIGVDRTCVLYANESAAFQENPTISGTNKRRDPVTGMPESASGSNAASISTQGVPYLPNNPNFMNILLDEMSSDLQRYVHCYECRNIGYVRLDGQIATVICPTCQQYVSYDCENGRIVEDTSEPGNFSQVDLRGVFYAAIRYLRSTFVDTRIEVKVPGQDETLGAYIE